MSKKINTKNDEVILNIKNREQKDYFHINELLSMITDLLLYINQTKLNLDKVMLPEDKHDNLFTPLYEAINVLKLDIDKMLYEKHEMQKKLFLTSKLASIGELAAGVGHEINNPLTVIQGNLEMLEENIKSNYFNKDDAMRSLRKQQDAITRITNIVKGLRIYAKTDINKIENIDIHKMIHETIFLIGKMYESDNIKIKLSLFAKNPYIYGNVGKFNQVIMALLSNAKDAMLSKKGGSIAIKTYNMDDSIIIKISDTGEGIEEGNLDKIFEAFFTTKEVGKATGLGLGIAYNIINSMKGEMSVRSQEGIGSTFTISLKTVTKEKQLEVVKKNETRSFNGKALVIDDEEDIREVLRNILEGFGLEVEEAGNGKIAYDKYKNQLFKYVFIDLKMPEMSGEEFIEAVSKLPNKESTLFVVTGAIAPDISNELNLKYKGVLKKCILKPFTKEDIQDLLNFK